MVFPAPISLQPKRLRSGVKGHGYYESAPAQCKALTEAGTASYNAITLSPHHLKTQSLTNLVGCDNRKATLIRIVNHTEQQGGIGMRQALKAHFIDDQKPPFVSCGLTRLFFYYQELLLQFAREGVLPQLKPMACSFRRHPQLGTEVNRKPEAFENSIRLQGPNLSGTNLIVRGNDSR